MTGSIDDIRRLVASESGLAVAVTLRSDGTPHSTVVNAGVVAHPVDGQPVVAFVSRGDTRKLRHLRERPYASVVFRVGWAWGAAEGPTDLAGPDDELAGLDGGGRPPAPS